jgi:transposase
VRCREDIRADPMRARHRLGKFLLRREILYEGPGQAWSRRHRAWLASLRSADRAWQLTIADYLQSNDVLVARRETIEDELSKLAVDSPCAVAIGRLRCLRGIRTLSVPGLCAEASGSDSITPTSYPRISGSCPPSTPPAASAAKARSRRPARPSQLTLFFALPPPEPSHPTHGRSSSARKKPKGHGKHRK